MPYFVSMILAIASAMVILLTRYDPDESAIKPRIQDMKQMVNMLDTYVNTYIEVGGDLSEINLQKLKDGNILMKNSIVNGNGLKSTLAFPNSEVKWQVIPNKDDKLSSYKFLVDMREDSTLMSKVGFSESFVGKEYCEKMLFGTFVRKANTYDETTKDFVVSGGTNSDGILSCTVYK